MKHSADLTKTALYLRYSTKQYILYKIWLSWKKTHYVFKANSMIVRYIPNRFRNSSSPVSQTTITQVVEFVKAEAHSFLSTKYLL